MVTATRLRDTHVRSRRPDSTVLNTTLDREAVELLYTYCPAGRRTTGRFLARLLYEHHARQLERQRLRASLGGLLSDDAPTTDADGTALAGAPRGMQALQGQDPTTRERARS